jgi:predicted nucleic acid-binding Zn ribbon protein
MATWSDDSSSAHKRRESSHEATLYQRKRWSLRKRREAEDHAQFDPRPVTDDDWSVARAEDEPSLTRISPPEALGSVLGDLVNRQGWASRLQSATLFSQWDAICGADIAAHCEPVRLAGGILVLRVESQIWATQLRYCVPDITQNIQTQLGIDNIRDVRIVVGPLENESH